MPRTLESRRELREHKRFDRGARTSNDGLCASMDNLCSDPCGAVHHAHSTETLTPTAITHKVLYSIITTISAIYTLTISAIAASKHEPTSAYWRAFVESSHGFALPHIATLFLGTYLLLSGYIRNEELLPEIGDNPEEARRINRDITKRKWVGFGIPLLALLYCIG